MGFLKVSTPLILAASLLSSLAQAAPAPRAIKAREYVTDVVTETVWETVDITTTVYVDELPSTSMPATTSANVTSSAAEVKSTRLSTSTLAATSALAPVVPAPAPAPSAPSSSEPAPAALSSAAGAFAESSAPPAPAYTAPAYTPPAPAPAAPATSEAAAPAAAPSAVNAVAASSGGSESATCQGGSLSCKGDVTHYDGGLGACGTNVDTEGEMAIALPFEFMGSASNSNPYCGKSVTVKTASGSTIQGTVKDKCMGCVGRSIDLTNKMFSAVTDGKGDGRVHNIEWWFS